MIIFGNNAAKLNEIIFANKNKSYGAYAIRSEYNESLLKSLGCLIGLLIGLFSISAYMNRDDKNIENEKIILADDLDSVLSIEYNHIELPKVEKKTITPPVKNNESAAAAVGGTPIISDTAPITTTVNTDNALNGKGPSTATGTSITNTAVTTNTVVNINTHEVGEIIETLVFAEEMPEFNSNPNGIMQYVGSNVNYPAIAKEMGRVGTVHVTFVVNEFGIVENIKILKGIGFGCDEEVMRVISKMPNWKKAGKHNGKAVKVRYNIPVSFKLK